MAKSNLEKTIEQAAAGFAMAVVDAVKSATLQELIALQTGEKAKPGRKPGRPPGKVAAKPKKKRVVKNYPKCAYPRCNKNRFPRGKGFCGDHWRMWKEGKIKAASTFTKAATKKAAPKKAAPKKAAPKKGKKK